MKKILIALATVALTSGVALANDFSGDLKYDAPSQAAPFFNNRYGDAAPRSNVVNEPRAGVDYSSTASIRNPDSEQVKTGPVDSFEYDRRQ
ncbi:hypothetical protein GA830_11890 [Mesorhizobium sp. NBSH29]|uniref:hypothetical protein n=1 Tax=Mesorhizobium sp. NBSH29 TaxID=2654249 RepID=UPI0018968BB3|nr:hypothetical protein [Mesorhizobium sp. NBSH29]QPC87363.1 hypothetical protein GA830_11890 [Mesorhizobium sp. NBSH29]